MESVINAAQLFLLLGLGFAYLLGLGWFALVPLLHGGFILKKRDLPLPQEIPLMLLSGLIINYALVLCFQSLSISLVIGSTLSLYGIGSFAFSMFRDPEWRTPLSASFKTYFAFVFVCILFLGPILADPLNEWDVRSIWF